MWLAMVKISFLVFLTTAFKLWLICKTRFVSHLPGTFPQEIAGLYHLLIPLHPAAWEVVSPSQTTASGWQRGELERDWIPEDSVRQCHRIRTKSFTTSLWHDRKISRYLESQTWTYILMQRIKKKGLGADTTEENQAARKTQSLLSWFLPARHIV